MVRSDIFFLILGFSKSSRMARLRVSRPFMVSCFLNMHTVFCFCLIQTACSLCVLVTLIVQQNSAGKHVLKHGFDRCQGDNISPVGVHPVLAVCLRGIVPCPRSAW